MIPFLSTPVMYGLAAVAVVGLAGAGVQSWRLHSEQTEHAKDTAAAAKVEEDRAKDYAKELDRRSKEFAAIQVRANELGTAIAMRDASLATIQGERDAAIKRATRGTACLRADAVRLLNGQSASPAVPQVPTSTSGQPDVGTPAGGTAPADASDTDVALYISDARTRYASCAERLNAWQDWYASLPQGAD